MSQSMKALVYEAPREMNMRTVPAPVPEEGEVLVRVCRVGICGSELSGYLGHNSLRVPPLIMGHEFAGVVATVGQGVSAFRPGDRVTVNPLVSCGSCRACRSGAPQLCADRRIIGAHRPGAFAEFVAAPAANVVLLPAEATMEQGALTEPLACAVHIAKLARLRPDHRLLVFGAGPIGLLVLLTARAYGLADVAVMDLNRERLKAAARCGGVAVDSTEALRAIAPQGGFDIAVDAVGVEATRRQAVELTRRGGRVVFSGLHEADSSLPVNDAVRNEIAMLGAFCYDTEDFAVALEWLSKGKIDLGDELSLFPLAEGQACFERLLSGDNAHTKIVLQVADE
ncbi:zinc-binding dehydrogenase [Paenibacillaceae bacterium WGS1546]|uniref:zinc-dependent alcohol dehydrogenase n=1 Tax=Cohnella sp. WGS1546 TaxID=3366810 RepID=UPI00372D4AD3